MKNDREYYLDEAIGKATKTINRCCELDDPIETNDPEYTASKTRPVDNLHAPVMENIDDAVDAVEISHEEIDELLNEPIELKSPYTTQVGGEHYQGKKHDLAQFMIENHVETAESCVMKYAYRHASKNGMQDLRKAQHYLQMIAYSIYGEEL